MSKLISKPEEIKLEQNKISTKVRCKKEFEFLMNNFNRVKSELSQITLKENSPKMQIIYKQSLDDLNKFKEMLNETRNSYVVFTKFFETYPSCMPYRNFIKKF